MFTSGTRLGASLSLRVCAGIAVIVLHLALLLTWEDARPPTQASPASVMDVVLLEAPPERAELRPDEPLNPEITAAGPLNTGPPRPLSGKTAQPGKRSAQAPAAKPANSAGAALDLTLGRSAPVAPRPGQAPTKKPAAPTSEIGEATRKGARTEDCRTAYAGYGPLAAPVLLYDAITNSGCRWR